MRKAELLEEPGEVALGLLQGDLRVGVDAEEKAGSQVGDGEGEAVGTIAEAELALVVGGPDVVGSVRDGLGAAGVSTAMAAPGSNEPVPGQDAGGGGGARVGERREGRRSAGRWRDRSGKARNGACGRARDSRSGRTARSGRSTCGQSYVRCRSGRPGRWWCRR